MTPDLLHRTALNRVTNKMKEYARLFEEMKQLPHCDCRRCDTCIRLKGINSQMLDIKEAIT